MLKKCGAPKHTYTITTDQKVFTRPYTQSLQAVSIQNQNPQKKKKY